MRPPSITTGASNGRYFFRHQKETLEVQAFFLVNCMSYREIAKFREMRQVTLMDSLSPSSFFLYIILSSLSPVSERVFKGMSRLRYDSHRHLFDTFRVVVAETMSTESVLK